MTDIAEPTSAPPPPAAVPPKKNVFQRIAGVLFAPGETFQDIVRKPDFLGMILIIIVLGLVSAGLTVSKIDPSSVLEQQAEQMRKQNPNVSEEQLDQIGRFTGVMFKVIAWAMPLIILVIYLVMAGVAFLVFRLFGAAGTFGQAFSVTLYANVPALILHIVRTIVILARPDKYDPALLATIVKSNPAFLVNMKEQAVLFAALSNLDVFVIWSIILLVIGYSVMSGFSRAKSAVLIISLWLISVVVQLGFTAMGAAR